MSAIWRVDAKLTRKKEVRRIVSSIGGGKRHFQKIGAKNTTREEGQRVKKGQHKRKTG